METKWLYSFSSGNFPSRSLFYYHAFEIRIIRFNHPFQFKTPTKQRKRPGSAPSTPREEKRRSGTVPALVHGTPRRVLLDHDYAAAQPSTCVECPREYEPELRCHVCRSATIATQTDETELRSSGSDDLLSPSGILSPPSGILSPPSGILSPLPSDILSQSSSSSPSRGRTDPEYVPTDTGESSSELGPPPPQPETSGLQLSGEHKFIVYKSKLDELLTKCPVCARPASSNVKTSGSMVTYTLQCPKNHRYVWRNEPIKHRVPLLNLLIPGAIIFTGNTFKKAKAFADALGIQFISEGTHNIYQKKSVMPVIQEGWITTRRALLDKIGDKPIGLSGDGRVDSPGHCGKYCLYSFMVMGEEEDADLCGKIIHMELADTAEPSIKNSQGMEPEGLRRGLKALAEDKVNVATVATDRHITIASIMRKEFPDISHQFDVWHVAKNFVKNLKAHSKKKGFELLGAWIKHLVNHLWWCCANCEGSADLLKEMWLSCLNHIRNVHSWTENTLFHECRHPPLSEEDREDIMWLKRGSPVFNLVRDDVMKTTLLKALRQLTEFCHTGQLEAFHNMLLQYCPKRLVFHHEGMKGRLLFAGLAWNAQDYRPRDTAELTTKDISVTFSKRRSDFVLKKRSRPRVDIVQKYMSRLEEVHVNKVQLSSMHIPELLPRTSRIEKPSKEEVLAKHKSRFIKKTT